MRSRPAPRCCCYPRTSPKRRWRARAARAELAIACAEDERLAALDLPLVSEAELASESHSPASGPGAAGAVLLPTSGTTGAAKLVRRSERALLALARGASQAFGLCASDRVAFAIPLCHSYGLDLLLAALAAGACAQLHPSFQLGALRRSLRDDGISVFPGVPVMLDALSRGDALAAPQLRRVLSAGSPLPLRVYERFRAISGLAIGQFYGATEFGAIAYNEPSSSDFDPLQVGTPFGGARVRIVAAEGDASDELPVGSVGRVAVAAPTLMDGYCDAPSPLRGDWYVTGDLGSFDALHGKYPGLVRVLVARDVPGANSFGIYPHIKDQPVLADDLPAILQPVAQHPHLRRRQRAQGREDVPHRALAQARRAGHDRGALHRGRERGEILAVVGAGVRVVEVVVGDTVVFQIDADAHVAEDAVAAHSDAGGVAGNRDTGALVEGDGVALPGEDAADGVVDRRGADRVRQHARAVVGQRVGAVRRGAPRRPAA